ncbi:DUF5320 domain-containing protein [Candidatus Sumerlaeota bacterium]|nr:DUF5320 domain-containing protein [Candidatus Sumerlaeota bacterium]
MPGMDGTGPRGMGAQAGHGCRMRYNGGARFGGTGYGCGLGWGFGRGMGFCRFAGATEGEVLTSVKASLQARLATIEQRLQKL